MIEFRKR